MKIIYIVFAAILLYSCSTTNQDESIGYSPRSASGENLNKSPQDINNLSQSDGNITQNRKMYYEAYMVLDVDEPEETLSAMKELVKGYDAYIVSSSKKGMIFRVKYDQLDSFIEKLSSLGEVSTKNIIGQDVTDQYDDLKIKLDNAYKTRDKYLKLLEKAVTVDEILKVEKELDRITETIQLLEGKIKRLDQIIAYSLVNVTVLKDVDPGPLGWVFVGLWEGISWLFVWN